MINKSRSFRDGRREFEIGNFQLDRGGPTRLYVLDPIWLDAAFLSLYQERVIFSDQSHDFAGNHIQGKGFSAPSEQTRPSWDLPSPDHRPPWPSRHP